MGTSMVSVTRYRQYAADCVQQAQGQDSADDKSILLNMALAWLRLAQQVEVLNEDDTPPTVPQHVDHHELSA
jgi:hypothetical protein